VMRCSKFINLVGVCTCRTRSKGFLMEAAGE
jgi:hypothetical protein